MTSFPMVVADHEGEARVELEELRRLRRVLYGLHAVLRLHFAEEDESYLSLFEPEAAGVRDGRPAADSGQPSAPGVPVCRAR